MSPEVKNYFQFCSLHGLEQLIKSPTQVTCSTSSLTDHILMTFPERVSQQGIIDVYKMSTISHKELKDLNWLRVINRFEQCVISIVFKFINSNCLYYLNEVFRICA